MDDWLLTQPTCGGELKDKNAFLEQILLNSFCIIIPIRGIVGFHVQSGNGNVSIANWFQLLLVPKCGKIVLKFNEYYT